MAKLPRLGPLQAAPTERHWIGLVSCLPAGTRTDQLERCRLLTEGQGWVNACRQAVAAGAAPWLGRFTTEGVEPHPLNLLRDVDERLAIRARAIALCGLCAIRIAVPACPFDTTTDSFLRAVEAWRRSEHEEIEPYAGAWNIPASTAHDPRSEWSDPSSWRLESIASGLYADRPDPAVLVVQNMVCELLSQNASVTSERTGRERTAVVPVLIDRRRDGVVAILSLRRLGRGPRALVADVGSMAFFRGNDQFHTALRKAWDYVTETRLATADPGQVVWSLHILGPDGRSPLLEVEGGSTGAGAAVGLLNLLDPKRRKLSPTWAVTGGIESDGALSSVRGYPQKLRAAREAGKGVILPIVDRLEAESIWATLGGRQEDLVPVSSIDQASKSMRHACRLSGRGGWPRAIAAAIVVAVITAALALLLAMQILSPASAQRPPAISHVVFSGSSADYTVTVIGTGFGPGPLTPHVGNLANCRIADLSRRRDYGYSTDTSVSTYTLWSNTKVVMTGWKGRPGDLAAVAVLDQGSGVTAVRVEQVPRSPGATRDSSRITSVTFRYVGRTSTLTASPEVETIIRGVNLGHAPRRMPYIGGTSELSFWDAQTDFAASSPFDGAGQTGNAISATYRSWTPARIVLDGFGGVYGQGNAVFAHGDPVVITIWSHGRAAAWSGNLL